MTQVLLSLWKLSLRGGWSYLLGLDLRMLRSGKTNWCFRLLGNNLDVLRWLNLGGLRVDLFLIHF